MHFYFTSEAAPSLDMQSHNRAPVPNIIKPTPQNPLYPRPQDPSLPYFNTIPTRYNTQYQEEPFQNNPVPVDIYQNNDFSAREFTPYPAIGIPHSCSPPFMTTKNRSFNNFQLEAQINPYGQVPEYSGFEMYREPAPEPFQPPYVDDYICTENGRLLADNQLKTKEAMPYLRPEDGTNGVVVEPQPEPKGQIQHTEEAPPPTTFKVGGHGMKGWCEEDEKLLRKLAVQYKFDWKKIAKKFANKKYTPHFLKMRYKGHDEGPVPKRIKFSHTEDILIAKFFNDYGIDWDRMATHFPNRTPIMIKNRYYSYIRKNNLLEGLLKEGEKLDGTQIEQASSQQVDSGENESVLLTNEEGESQSQTELSKEEQEQKSSSKEVALLKAQLKSLKSLYVITYRQLNKLKSDR